MTRIGIHLNVALMAYITFTMMISKRVWKASKQVIDEEFHLRQGLFYCRGNFSVWDPKITTFPGLYLFSTFLLMPLKACTASNLRLTSVVASIVNLVLIYKIRQHLNRQLRLATSNWWIIFESLTIAILPPMYFFSFLYYTDIVSITFVLGTVLYSMRNQHLLATMMSFLAVTMRQTNVIWVGVIFGQKALELIVTKRMQKVPDVLSYLDIYKSSIQMLKDSVQHPRLVCQELLNVVKHLWGYILVLSMFCVFVFLNGSIVVGDKSAHGAQPHIVQVCYFALFSLVFGVQNTLLTGPSILKEMLRDWKKCGLLALVLLMIVHFNTIVHPYLLADNRHYTFYLWSRFYGRYTWAKYAAVPLYVFALTVMRRQLTNIKCTLSIFYAIGLLLTIGLQQLIEIRYFLIPFLFLRIFLTHNPKYVGIFLILEFLTYVLVNAITFYLFFTKEIWWSNYSEVQRIIW